MSGGSWCGRRAIAAGVVAAIALASVPARAQPLPPSPEAAGVAPTASLPRYWPHKTFERRSTGLMVLAIVFASTAATVVASGGVVYGEASDPCLDGHRKNSSNAGHFCYADRSQFDVGMGMMAVGGAVFAIAVPLAVWAGSGTPREQNQGLNLRLGPSGASLAGSF